MEKNSNKIGKDTYDNVKVNVLALLEDEEECQNFWHYVKMALNFIRTALGYSKSDRTPTES